MADFTGLVLKSWWYYRYDGLGAGGVGGRLGTVSFGNVHYARLGAGIAPNGVGAASLGTGFGLGD